jgi:hypothetical protein
LDVTCAHTAWFTLAALAHREEVLARTAATIFSFVSLNEKSVSKDLNVIHPRRKGFLKYGFILF